MPRGRTRARDGIFMRGCAHEDVTGRRRTGRAEMHATSSKRHGTAVVQDLGNVYILSAGRGLIAGDFLTPYYDITFSPSARSPDACKRRRKADKYRGICMLPDNTDEEVVFFGGKDYVPLFCTLTIKVKSKTEDISPHGGGTGSARLRGREV